MAAVQNLRKASSCLSASPRSYTAVARPNRPVCRRLRPVCFRENEKAQQQAESVEKQLESKVAQTTKRVTRQVSGFLSNPNSQAQCFWYLGSAALTTALLCLIAPGPFAGMMFKGTTDPVVNTLVRAAGATLVTSAVVKYTLKEAAVRDQLHLATFRRLNLGLVLQTGATLVIGAQAVSIRNNLLTGYMMLVCLPGLLLASRMYALYKPEGGLPLPSPAKTVAAMLGVLMPRNLPAAAYSILTLAFAGMAAMCLSAAPGEAMKLYPGFHGPLTIFSERCAGAGLILMTLVAYSLKDGADRGKLGATSFRWLNLGLAGSLLSMVWYFSADYESGVLLHTAKSLGMMAAIIASFMWTGYMYITGTSKPKPQPAS